ncbi:hypothetical protein GW17_00029258 [Ensete ventricosum]|nr:hypothetical protein GW17_00029258 [Ensete ventricosum]
MTRDYNAACEVPSCLIVMDQLQLLKVSFSSVTAYFVKPSLQVSIPEENNNIWSIVHLQTEKHKIEERSKVGEEGMVKLTKEKEKSDKIISDLTRELETIKRTYADQFQQMDTKAEEYQIEKLTKEKEKSDKIISDLTRELETIKRTYADQFQQMDTKAKEYQIELERKLKDAESFLAESQRRIQELETDSESKFQNWNQREHVFQSFVDLQMQSVQVLRCLNHILALPAICWFCYWITLWLRSLASAVCTGNIRVYCRIRPFLPGENRKQSTIDYIGENGELLAVNPSKPGKDGQRMFKFNKVFGPAATQGSNLCVWFDSMHLTTKPALSNMCLFFRCTVASLKDTIARKDEEIEQLQQTKDIRSKHSSSPLKHSSSTNSVQGQERMSSVGRAMAANKVGADHENWSEHSGEVSESGSHQSADDTRQQKEHSHPKLSGEAAEQSSADPELLGFGDADSEERLSDISDGGLSMGTETDGSIGSLVEYNLFPEQAKSSDTTKEKV